MNRRLFANSIDRARSLAGRVRSPRGVLFGAIAALFVAGVIAAALYPGGPAGRFFSLEAGSLLAPRGDSRFADGWGSPEAPPPVTESSPGQRPGDGYPSPMPPAPVPPTPPTGDKPPRPDGSLLPDLPFLPPLPAILSPVSGEARMGIAGGRR